MLRTLLFLASLFIHLNLHAAPPDVALVHFDKSFYVSGEVVWYKLYLPASAQGKDFSVRASVLDGAGKSVSETFLAVEKKAVCYGYFALAFDAAPGVYAFIFSTSRKNGTSDELLHASVPVYNDLALSAPGMNIQAVSDTPPNLPPGDLKVTLQLASGEPPNVRQALRLNITVTDQLGNPVVAEGSLSVTDEELCGAKVFPVGNLQSGGNFPAEFGGADWMSGIYKNGHVRHADGRLMTSNFLPLLDLETQKLHIAKSEAGWFTLQIPAYAGTRRLQMLGVQEEPMKVSWDGEMFLPVDQKLRFTEGIARYLDLSRKRKKIYQFYGQTESDLKIQINDLPAIDWKSKQSFKVQNYERFPDLATFFQELIWRVKFRKQGDRYAARMYNVDIHDDFPEPPLFILDQKATYDADFVARLDPANIETIELLFEPKLLRKYYPAIGGGGVVRIKTLSGNQSLPHEKEIEILALQGLLLPAAFPEVLPNSSEPFLRPVVFWQPSFTTDKNGAATLQFVQSDDRSTFCAEVLVQGPDGRRGYGRLCYKVE